MKKSCFLRYEFTNEKGKPEGGDIFEFASIAEAQELVAQILKVTQSDGVSVNVTFGEEKSFFGFLANVGISREEAETERVPAELAPAKGKASKKAPAKKTAKKAKAKKK